MLNLFAYSGREYENLIMDCCQLEDGVTGVKREDTAGNDPENGSPDADRGGMIHVILHIQMYKLINYYITTYK